MTSYGHSKRMSESGCKCRAKSVSAYVKVVYKPEGDVLTIEKKITKHHQE